MPAMKEEKSDQSFQKTAILAEDKLGGGNRGGSAADGVWNPLLILSISDEKFKIISDKIKLPENATKKEKTAALVELYGLLKSAEYQGGLGIEYQYSEGRMPKTPEEVLTPEKDGKMRADCDELALLFVASAVKLGLDISDISLLSLTFQTKETPAGEEGIKHMAILVKSENSFMLMDLTMGMRKYIDESDAQTLFKTYVGQSINGEEITGVQGFDVIFGVNAMAAVHYSIKASKYYDKKEYAEAYDEYLSAFTLDPTEKRKLAAFESCIKAAEAFYLDKDHANAEKYFKTALGFSMKENEVKMKLIEVLVLQQKNEKYEEALALCDELIKSDPKNEEFYKYKAWTAKEAGMTKLEIETLEKWKQIANDKSEIYLRLANAYAKEKRYLRLEELAKEWKNEKPYDSRAYKALSYALLQEGTLLMNEATEMSNKKDKIAELNKAEERLNNAIVYAKIGMKRCQPETKEYKELETIVTESERKLKIIDASQ